MFGMPMLELQETLPQVLSLSFGLREAVGVLFFGTNLWIFLLLLVEVVGCILPLLFVVSIC